MQYEECKLETTAMNAEAFLASDRTDMARRFSLVIQAEGPIVDDLLQKRVLHSYGLAKRGKRIQPVLDEVMHMLQERRTLQISADGKEHQVFWPNGMESLNDCRIPSTRDITEYPIVEIANLMETIPTKNKKELFEKTARALGFKKKGTNIRKSFSLAYRLLKKKKQP